PTLFRSEGRLGAAHRFGLIPRGRKSILIILAVGDIRINVDYTSVWQRIVPDFDDRTVRPCPLRQVVPGSPCREPLDLGVNIDVAVFASFCLEANKVAEMRLSSQERLG